MKNNLIILFFATLGIYSCKTTKISKIGDYSNIEFDYFSNRSKIKIDKSGMNFTLLLNLRIKDDSLIWMNISNTLVGKIGKCKVTEDSLYVLKDFQGKEYFTAGIASLNQKIGFDLSLHMLQNIFLGNMPLDMQENTTLSKEADGIHITQNALGYNLLNVLNPKTKKLNRLRLTNGTTYIELEYTDYEQVGKHIIPTELFITSNSTSDLFQQINGVKIVYQKNTFTSEPISFPFKVSSRYVHKKF